MPFLNLSRFRIGRISGPISTPDTEVVTVPCSCTQLWLAKKTFSISVSNGLVILIHALAKVIHVGMGSLVRRGRGSGEWGQAPAFGPYSNLCPQPRWPQFGCLEWQKYCQELWSCGKREYFLLSPGSDSAPILMVEVVGVFSDTFIDQEQDPSAG